jgi:hypothetical protein
MAEHGVSWLDRECQLFRRLELSVSSFAESTQSQQFRQALNCPAQAFFRNMG